MLLGLGYADLTDGIFSGLGTVVGTPGGASAPPTFTKEECAAQGKEFYTTPAFAAGRGICLAPGAGGSGLTIGDKGPVTTDGKSGSSGKQGRGPMAWWNAQDTKVKLILGAAAGGLLLTGLIVALSPSRKAPAKATPNRHRKAHRNGRVAKHPALDISRVPLDRGGYSRDGRYFGVGAPVYTVYDADSGRYAEFRAKNYAQAKSMVTRAIAKRGSADRALLELETHGGQEFLPNARRGFMSKRHTSYFVVPKMGPSDSYTLVVSSHHSLDAARKACIPGWEVRRGELRAGDRFDRALAGLYPASASANKPGCAKPNRAVKRPSKSCQAVPSIPSCRCSIPAKHRRAGIRKKSDYAFPECFMYPINTPSMVRNALSRFGQFSGNIPTKYRTKVAKRIMKAEKKFGLGPYRSR